MSEGQPRTTASICKINGKEKQAPVHVGGYMLYLKLDVLRTYRKEQKRLKKELNKLYPRVSANAGSDKIFKEIRRIKSELNTLEFFCKKEWDECTKLLDASDDCVKKACENYFNKGERIKDSCPKEMDKKNFLRNLRKEIDDLEPNK